MSKENRIADTTSNKGTYENKKLTGPLSIRMTNDLLFKHLLQDDPDTLRNIICSLLHMDASQIETTKVTNPILMGETITDKNVILDVNVLMNDSTCIDLEMQVINYGDWPIRSLIYGVRNLDDLESGHPYQEARPSIQIGFLDFQLFDDHPKFYSLNRMMDVDDHHLYTDILTIGVVDLTNIDLATDIDKQYNVDKWARFFKAETWEELDMIATEYPEVEKTVSHLKTLTAEEKFRLQCQAREDALRRENTFKFGLENAKKENAKLASENAELKKENIELKQELAELKRQSI